MISVIFAVYNGSSTLPRMLKSLERLEPTDQGWEVIAINNASTDRTQDLLQQYTDRLPLRILHESRRGKSYALNRGMVAARGDLLVFTDDDIIADRFWLMAYARAAKRYPDVGVFAGQVRHAWDAPPPDWLLRLADLGMSYGGTPRGLGEEMVSPSSVKGANFMVRKLSANGVRFDVKEGTAFTGEGSSVGGEDTLFAKEVEKRSRGVIFTPDALVKHIVRAEQVGVLPVFRRYLRIGATNPIRPNSWRRIGPMPLWVARRVGGHALRCITAVVLNRKYEAAREMIEVAQLLGAVRAAARVGKMR